MAKQHTRSNCRSSHRLHEAEVAEEKASSRTRQGFNFHLLLLQSYREQGTPLKATNGQK